MKQLLAVVFAAALVFGAAGNASAAFSAGDIVQYIYEGDTDAGKEFGTGLFNVGSPLNPTALPADGTKYTAGQPAADLSDFTTTAWDDLYGGFVSQASDVVQGAQPWLKDTTIDVYFATTKSTLPSVNTGAFTILSGNASTLINTTGGGAKDKSTTVSYWESIEFQSGLDGNYQGNYAGFNNINPADGFVSLADLADGIGSYVDMYLWQYRSFDKGGTTTGDYMEFVGEGPLAQLRIGLQDDGTGAAQLYTEINPVPVPAAVWLLGSGLLGLIGIRRRNA